MRSLANPENSSDPDPPCYKDQYPHHDLIAPGEDPIGEEGDFARRAALRLGSASGLVASRPHLRVET